MVINDGSTTIIITYRNVFSSELKTSPKYANDIFSQFALFSFSKGGNKEAVRYKKSAKHNATNKAHIEKKTIAQ